jgi:hypothetical protein
MSKSARVRIFAAVLIGTAAAALIASCSSGGGDTKITKPSTSQGGAEQGGTGGSPAGGTSGIPNAGAGGSIIDIDGATDVVNETPVNQCGSQCGPTELCDQQFLGYDDNCNGFVDEGCPCTPGLSHWCFKGDPASRNKGACKDGTEKCNEIGQWGACLGGFHADATDNCLGQGTPTGCHDLTVAPFTVVNLKDGTGTFGQNATNVQFDVACPPQIPGPNCPKVQNGASMDATYTPLQSGQYTVTFTKGGGAESCTFSVYVGSGGLRVELNWDHQGEGALNHYGDDAGGNSGGNGPDLDLHLHKPGVKSVWFAGAFGMKKDDCFYGNCTAANFVIAMMSGPNWFTDNAYPHNWTYKTPYDPNDPTYTCYNAPRGAGQEWKTFKKGCHNPRLDLDNIVCDKNATDPQSDLFCAPENVNIDEPPIGLWTRVGVHYYGHCYSGDLHPTISIYCAGAQVAQLGPTGYNAPVTFPASGCGEDDGSSNTFWLVADVMAVQGMCGEVDCVVQPLYADPGSKTPLLSTGGDAKAGFGPDCPAAPPDAGGPGCN